MMDGIDPACGDNQLAQLQAGRIPVPTRASPILERDCLADLMTRLTDTERAAEGCCKPATSLSIQVLSAKEALVKRRALTDCLNIDYAPAD